MIAEAANELVAALKTVPGLRVSLLTGDALNPPVAVVGPPSVEFGSYGGAAPTSMTFTVNIAVAMDSRALGKLWHFVTHATAAVEQNTDSVVTAATPGILPVGGSDLPSYQLTVDYPARGGVA